jgi:outer membrane receptor protein involved in Fe transport
VIFARRTILRFLDEASMTTRDARTGAGSFATLLLALSISAAWSPAFAQSAPASAAPSATPAVPAAPPAGAAAGSISGTVIDAQQHPVGGVAIDVFGPQTLHTQSAQDGTYAFRNVTPGIYRLSVTKAGFTPASQDNVIVLAGSVTTAAIQLTAAQFTSIREIGRVSVSSSARNAINTSTAAVATVTGATFTEQGQQVEILRTLDELPGVSIGIGSGFSDDGIANGASPLVTGIPSIRGALPYETASLIDGHPISIGVYGTFNPAILSPYMLDDVEVVKGPGASAPNINYAIGGTINFRTLEPTRIDHESLDTGIDQFGGESLNLRATGSTDGGKLGYAFDYQTSGTQGPDRNYAPQDPLNLSNGALVNGKVACGNPTVAQAGACFPSVVPTTTNFAAASNLTAPLLICCPQIPLESGERHELAKVRYNFTPTTALTLSYLGGQLRGSSLAADLFLFPSYFFGPPAGYSSSVYPSGFPVFQNDQGPSELDVNANLYQADFHTAVGPATVNARYYVSGDDVANLQYPSGSNTVSGALYGGVPLGQDTTPTIFTGQQGTVELLNSFVGVRTKDALHGYTVEADVPGGNNIYSLSYDAIHTESSAYSMFSPANAGEDNVSVQPGSGQSFQTIMARGQFQVRPDVSATLSNYIISYTDHYTQDNGASFTSSTHGYDAPRLALSWRPDRDLAVRASTGFSISPPYIQLLTNQSAAVPDRTPPTAFNTTGNAGDVSPETAFGFDLGFDQRVSGIVISPDVYETTLHNQFLSTTALNGTITLPANNPYGATPGTPYPLYVTQTANLGHSRYEGLELAIHHDPLVGYGFRMQGYLQRAYAYDLPAGFYDTASGKNTANLGILPGENFQASGQGYNALSSSRVPYSGGYGEINYRFRSGAYFLTGITYYGPNNAYNEPAFGVVNASFKQPITKHASLQLAASNLTNAYSSFQYNIYGGIPTPLVNGQLGYTAGNVIGPSTTSLILHLEL